MKKPTYSKGFTIIELLVVISIIFILMGLLVPKIGGYRKKANELKADSYAKQLYTATMASYAENHGEFNTDSIKNNIKELVNLTEDKDVKLNVIGDENGATISFCLEKKKYTLRIDKDGYDLKDGENKEIESE